MENPPPLKGEIIGRYHWKKNMESDKEKKREK
jgi:hypothetical protein